MKEKIILFVYGTLKKGNANNRYLMGEDVKYLGEGVTAKSYKLYAHDGFPFAYKQRGPARIKGEVYEIGEETLALCDRLEGHPRFYKRETVPVKLDGKTVKAWLYFINVVPDYYYVVEITDGEFPASYAAWDKKYAGLLKDKRQ